MTETITRSSPVPKMSTADQIPQKLIPVSEWQRVQQPQPQLLLLLLLQPQPQPLPHMKNSRIRMMIHQQLLQSFPHIVKHSFS